MTLIRLAQQGALSLLLFCIGLGSALSATTDRAPRDYYIYLDYSASIVGPDRPNKQLGGMLKSMLKHKDASGTPMYLPGRDKVYIYRFGSDFEPLANDWEIALDSFTAQNTGDKVTNFRPVLDNLKREIADGSGQNADDFRAKVFIIASDFIHDALPSESGGYYDGCAAKDEELVSVAQQALATQVQSLDKTIEDKDQLLKLNIPVGLVYYPTTPRFKNNPEAATCFTNQINNAVLLRAFERHFDTQRLTYDDSGDFADNFAKAMSDRITAQFKDLSFNTQQGRKPIMERGKMFLPLLIDNQGIKDTELYGVRIWKDKSARTPLSTLIPLSIPEQVRAGTIGLDVPVPIPKQVVNKLLDAPAFYVELVESRNKDKPSTRGRVRPFQPLAPGTIAFSNDLPGTTQAIGDGFLINLPVVNQGETSTNLIGIRLRASATAAQPTGPMIPIKPPRTFAPGRSDTLTQRFTQQQLEPLLDNDRYYLELVDKHLLRNGRLPAAPTGDIREYLPPSHDGSKLEFLRSGGSWWDPESSLFNPALLVRIRNTYFTAQPVPNLVLRIVQPDGQDVEDTLILSPASNSPQSVPPKDSITVSYPITNQADIAKALYQAGNYTIHLQDDQEPQPQSIPRLKPLIITKPRIDVSDASASDANGADAPLVLSFFVKNDNPLIALVSTAPQYLINNQKTIAIRFSPGEETIPSKGELPVNIPLLRNDLDSVDPLSSVTGDPALSKHLDLYKGIPVAVNFPFMDTFVPGGSNISKAIIGRVNSLSMTQGQPNVGPDPKDKSLRLKFTVTNHGPLPELLTNLLLQDGTDTPIEISSKASFSPPLPILLSKDKSVTVSIPLQASDQTRLNGMTKPNWLFQCLRGKHERADGNDGEYCGQRMPYSFNIKPLQITERKDETDNRWTVDARKAELTLRLKNENTWSTQANQAFVRNKTLNEGWYPIPATQSRDDNYNNAVNPRDDKPVRFRLERTDWPGGLFQCDEMIARVQTLIDQNKRGKESDYSKTKSIPCPRPSLPLEHIGKAHWESAVPGQEQNVLVMELTRNRDGALPNRPIHLFFSGLDDENLANAKEATLPPDLEWVSDQTPTVTYRIPVDQKTLSEPFFSQKRVQVRMFDRSNDPRDKKILPISFEVDTPTAAPIRVTNVIDNTGLPVLTSDQGDERISLDLTNPNASLPQEITKLRWYVQRDATKADMEFSEQTHPGLFPIVLPPGEDRRLTFSIPEALKPEWNSRIKRNRTAFIHATTASLQPDDPKKRSQIETVKIKVDLKVYQVQLITSGKDLLSLTYKFTVDNQSDTQLSEVFEAQIRERFTNKLLASRPIKRLTVSNNQQGEFSYTVLFRKTDAIGKREISDVYGSIAQSSNPFRYASTLPDSGIIATLIYRAPDLLRWLLIVLPLAYWVLRILYRRKQNPSHANQIGVFLPRFLEALGLLIAALSIASFSQTTLVENFVYAGWLFILAISYGTALIFFDLVAEHRFAKELRSRINSGEYRGQSLQSVAALLERKYRGISLLLFITTLGVFTYLLWPSLTADTATYPTGSANVDVGARAVSQPTDNTSAASEKENQS